MKLSVCLITYNEAENLAECLETVKWVDEIIIVDQGSQDGTLEIAKGYTSHVNSISFVNFSQQKNEAIKLATGDWIFFIDADERMTPELRKEIEEILVKNPQENVYSVKRESFLFGKHFHYSGMQDDYPIRLFPKEKAHYEQPVHEVIVTDLNCQRMKQHLLHYSTRDIRHYFSKMEQYITFEVEVMAGKKKSCNIIDLYLRPIYKFLYRFVLKFGFLDGREGLKFAYLSAYYDYQKYKRYQCWLADNSA